MVRRVLRHWRFYFREPGDVLLMFAVGWFIARAPRLIAAHDWRALLERLRQERSLRASSERVMRMRTFWLCRRFMASHNTCYIRALTLFRFLEHRGETIGLHIGIEHRTAAQQRLHGHAWVTLGERIIEGPPAALEGRIREINVPAAR